MHAYGRAPAAAGCRGGGGVPAGTGTATRRLLRSAGAAGHWGGAGQRPGQDAADGLQPVEHLGQDERRRAKGGAGRRGGLHAGDAGADGRGAYPALCP